MAVAKLLSSSFASMHIAVVKLFMTLHANQM